jgi:hypothetical protein
MADTTPVSSSKWRTFLAMAYTSALLIVAVLLLRDRADIGQKMLDTVCWSLFLNLSLIAGSHTIQHLAYSKAGVKGVMSALMQPEKPEETKIEEPAK